MMMVITKPIYILNRMIITELMFIIMIGIITGIRFTGITAGLPYGLRLDGTGIIRMVFIFRSVGDGIRIMITGGDITDTMIHGIPITGGDTRDGIIHMTIITETGRLPEEGLITEVISRMHIL